MLVHCPTFCPQEGEGSVQAGESEVSGKGFPLLSQDSTQCCLPAQGVCVCIYLHTQVWDAFTCTHSGSCDHCQIHHRLPGSSHSAVKCF